MYALRPRVVLAGHNLPKDATRWHFGPKNQRPEQATRRAAER
jgi:hypothetical protein